MVSMLPSVLAVIAPVFLLIALGFACARTGYVVPSGNGALSGFVMKVAMPALIFRAVNAQPIAEVIQPGFVAAYAGACLAVFAFGWLRARYMGGYAATPSAIRALGMSCPNSGFMGYPIAAMVVGAPVAGANFAQFVIVEAMLLIPLGLAVAEIGAGAGRPFRQAARETLGNLARSPLLIGLAAGVAFAATGLSLPGYLQQVIDMLSAVAAPVALFVVGTTVAGLSGGARPSGIAWVVAGKLVLHPLVFLGALLLVPGLDPLVIGGAVISCAAPMMSIYPIFGAQFGEQDMAATALLAATVVSFLTIATVIALTGWAGMVALPG